MSAVTDEAFALHTTAIGEPTRVVFLHGLFGQGKNFTTAARALEPDLGSLLVDLPNHGRSGWTARFDYVQTADLIAAELARGAAAERPVHLVGHSLGGKVAMVLALRHPELIDKLVVVDISPVGHADMSEFEHLLGSLAQLDLATLGRRAEADAQLSGPVPDAAVRGFLLQNLRGHTGSWHWQANLDLLRAALPVIATFPELPGTPPFDHPVLWVAGERSPYIRPEHAEPMRRLFPRTTRVTIKGAGHWVHSEAPVAFVSALRHFLLA